MKIAIVRLSDGATASTTDMDLAAWRGYGWIPVAEAPKSTLAKLDKAAADADAKAKADHDAATVAKAEADAKAAIDKAITATAKA